MKLDKQGKYRFNMYLNPKLEKDKVIIEYLEQKYSAPDFIKEMLYGMAIGSQVCTYNNTHVGIMEVSVTADKSASTEIAEPYEEIENPDEIDLEME